LIIAQLCIPNIPVDAKWMRNSVTVAGGNGYGNGLDQLHHPYGVYVDDDETIYVADTYNHRIMEWKNGAKTGRVVAGEKGQANREGQLNSPYNVIVDKSNDSFIISDSGNSRVMQWPRQNGTSGQTIISNINCRGLAMDSNACLYVCDVRKHEVKRCKIGDTNGTVVAGGNGIGNHPDQLYCPYYIFVDQDQSVYVSDYANHRVMKWTKDAKEGVVVAGGQGDGNGMNQLSYPRGVIVDQLGTVYVADESNHRVMRWLKGATKGTVAVGGNGQGGQANQFYRPYSLSFDRQNNLYVADLGNHRVQKFNIEP
jgi:sugar lactone lactonase YvrE